jgi:hypothetical protein
MRLISKILSQIITLKRKRQRHVALKMVLIHVFKNQYNFTNMSIARSTVLVKMWHYFLNSLTIGSKSQKLPNFF